MKKGTNAKPGWEEVEGPAGDGGTVCTRMPADRLPALARVGMCCTSILHSGVGRIVEATRQYCIVETEKGEAAALPWSVVQLVDARPAAPAAGAAAPEAAEPDPLPDWHLQLWTECEVIEPAVLLNAAPDDPLRGAFAEARLRRSDKVPPDADKLRRALDLFYERPEAEQRRLLNGWSPCRDKPTREELLAEEARLESPVRRVVSIDLGPRGEPFAFHEAKLDDGTGRASVEVPEYMSQAEAVRQLTKLLAAVADPERWPEMIGKTWVL